VNKWGLIEINPVNRKFTWANNQEKLILAKLGRIFISTAWEAAFPLVRVRGLDKSTSDHIPLLVDSGECYVGGKKKFQFEKWWLEREDFQEIVKRAWGTPYVGLGLIDVWQNKIRSLRRMVRGWASNVIVELNRHKQAMTREYNCMDLESESRELDSWEKVRMRELAKELDKMWALEEIKIRQRLRDRIIKEENMNTPYFHAIANHRWIKKELSI
jgi:hypothetical protein